MFYLSSLVNTVTQRAFQGLGSHSSKILGLIDGNGRPFWEVFLGAVEQCALN